MGATLDAPSRAPAGVARRTARADMWGLVALVTLAALVRLPTLDAQSYWYDESFTVALLQHGLPTMLRLVPRTESTPPLYYAIAWLWTRPLGTGELGLRSFSALAGIAAVPLVWRTAWEVCGQRAAVTAGALVATHPLLVWYSQEARAYALLVALVALCLLAFVRALRCPSPRLLAAWALTGALVLATHYFAALLVGVQAIWLLTIVPPRRRRAAAAAVAGLVLAASALLPIALRERASGNANWIAHLGLAHRLGQVGHDLLVGLGPTLPAPWVGVCASIAVLGLALTAAGQAAPPELAVGVAAVALLALAGLAATLTVARSAELQRPDWAAVATALGSAPSPRVVTVPGGARARPLLLYLPRARQLSPAGASVSELDIVATRVRRRKACWWGAFCNIPPRPLPARSPVAGFDPAGRTRAGLFEIARFRSARARAVTPAALGVRRGSARSPAALLQVGA